MKELVAMDGGPRMMHVMSSLAPLTSPIPLNSRGTNAASDDWELEKIRLRIISLVDSSETARNLFVDIRFGVKNVFKKVKEQQGCRRMYDNTIVLNMVIVMGTP